MACTIFRDSNNNIQSVLDPQGNPSKLYNSALELYNEEQALEIAMTPYTEEYKASNGAITQEPDLETVMTYISRYNNQNKKLTKTNIDELRNNTLTLPFSYIEEISSQLGELYPKGIFTLNKQTLRKSQLYTETEIQTILGDGDTQKNIKSFADKVIAEASLNNDNVDSINSNLALYETPELISVQDTSELIGIGKFRELNPFLIDKGLRQKVGGIKNREQFETALDTANEAIVEQYYSNTEFANNLFEAYSQMDRMPLLEDDAQGGLSAKVNNNIKTFTQQSLILDADNTQLLNIIDLLKSTPPLVWANSSVEIEDMLLRVEDYATDAGIDVIGISDQEYTYNEMQNLLSSVESLALGNIVEADIQNFADNYNSVFKNNLAPLITARNINPSNKGRNLVVVDSIKSEQQLFDENNLVKANNEGVYHRINRQQDIENLYDYVTDLVQFNPNVIDKQALYSTAYSNNVFNYKKASNPVNKEAIRDDIRRYVQQQGFSEELTLYKIAFGHPLTFPAPIIDKQQEISKALSVKENYDYLTKDYIADFARTYLQEKLNNSDIFNKLYNHFAFNERGIVLKDNDPYSKQEISLLTPENSLLRQYTAISKDSDLNTLFAVPLNEAILEKSVREFYMNNPEQLPQKTLQYELTEDEAYLATQNLQDNYLNINNEIWEKVKPYKNITIYQRLPNIQDPNFNRYNIDVNINFNVDTAQFLPLIQSLETMAKIEKMYTKKELENINNSKEC